MNHSKITTMKQKMLLLVLLPFFVMNFAYTQTFVGFKAAKRISEYQGQRFLMTEVYDITSAKIDELALKETFVHEDNDEGFIIKINSYKFNEKRGIAISSFFSQSFNGELNYYVNIHLSDNEFERLDRLINILMEKESEKPYHLLTRFNDRIVVDVKANSNSSVPSIIIWVDNHSRHSFNKLQWKELIKQHNKFLDKI